METTGETLEELRAALLDPARGKDDKVPVLKKLVRRAAEPGVRQILKDIATCEANAPHLEYMVRGFGYLKDPAAVPDVLPFVAHPRPAVVASAIKALCALDPGAAMRAAVPLIRRSKDKERVWAAAGALASKAPELSRRFFRELASSPRSRHRAAALIQVKTLPPDEAVPILLQMLASERQSKLRKLLLEDLAERAGPAHAQLVQMLRRDLAIKVRELGALHAKLGGAAPVKVKREPGVSGVLDPMSSPDLKLPAPPPAATASGATLRPAAPAASSPSVPRPSRPIPIPIPSAGRPTGSRPALTPPPGRAGMPRPLALGLAALCIAALVVAANFQSSYQAVTRGGAAEACPLGGVGARVQFSAKVESVDAATRSLKLSGPGGLAVTGLLGDQEVSGFAPGKSVQVEGILRDFKSGSGAVVQCFAVR